MKTKKLFMIFAIVFSVFALTGLALAANNVSVNVTSEPIHAKAESDKAGGFALTFDEGTVLAAGDQITIDLSYGVTLAKDIDIEISAGGSETPWSGSLTGGGNIPQTGAPVICPTDDGNLGVGNQVVTATNGGVYFHVYGTKGTQRITVDVLGAPGASLTVNDVTTDADTLKLYFLDQQTNPFDNQDGIYVEGATAGVYDQDATLGDNTLCINVSQYDGNTVLASFDSKDDKFTFVPSNPEIAHVVSALDITFDECKGQEPGYIEMGSKETQAEETCTYFDNETSYGFCATRENKMIIKSSAPFDQAQYQIKLEILVNGESGDNGVYWSNQQVAADGFDTHDDACNASSAVAISGTYVYELANGDDATPDTPHSGECDVEDEARAVVLTTPETDLNLDSTSDYLWIDLPAFNYDLDEIQEGDVVSVKVTIIKVPCGQVFQDTWEIGTFGCPVTGATMKLLFPYFTKMADGADSYWDGIAIVNGSDSDGKATLTIYEADGDVATMEVDVPAHSMYVNLLSAMVGDMTLTTSEDGTLGNARAYIVVTTDFAPADGFAMMAESATGSSMGYLPRNMNLDLW